MSGRGTPALPAVNRIRLKQGFLALLILAFGSASLFAQVASPNSNIVRNDTGKAPDPDSRLLGSKPEIALFRAHCVSCHDADGRGEIGRALSAAIPDFTLASWQKSRTDAQLGRTITEGQGKSMPALKGKLSSEEVASLVTLVRKFQDGRLLIPEDAEEDREAKGVPPNPEAEPAPLDPAPSQDTRNASWRETNVLYQRSCRACHGENGKGELVRASMPEIPDFTADRWVKRRTPAEMTVSILDGKGRRMPPFGAALSNEQAKSLMEYIQAFGSNRARVVGKPAADFDLQYAKLRQEFESLRR
jgi:mono/diheme cytochrome c family protein